MANSPAKVTPKNWPGKALEALLPGLGSLLANIPCIRCDTSSKEQVTNPRG